MRVGVISDTHGLLRQEAIDALNGVEHILHAGDVGAISVIHRLQQIAPVTAIRGNIDIHGPCSDLPRVEAIVLSGHFLYMLHSLESLDLSPVAAKINVIVSGHTHAPSIDLRDGILFLNPGSAGPRRFKLPVSIAILNLASMGTAARIVELSVP